MIRLCRWYLGRRGLTIVPARQAEDQRREILKLQCRANAYADQNALLLIERAQRLIERMPRRAR